MPQPDYTIRQNDFGEQIVAVLEDANGDPVDLTGADVVFQLAPIGGGALVVDAAAAFTSDGSDGSVGYTWQADDTDTAGWYLASWRVTYSGGEVQTFPNGTYTLVRITGELGQIAAVGGPGSQIGLPDWWTVDQPHQFVLADGGLAIGEIADYAASIGANLALSVAEDDADGSSTTLYIPGFGSTDVGPVGGLSFSQGSPGAQPGALSMLGSVIYLQMPDADTFNPGQSLPPVTLFGYKNNGVGGNPFIDILQVWKDYSTGLAWGIGYGGQEWLQAASPPVDAQILAGQRWQWYEDTVGAVKLRIWEKDSAGTLIKRISAVYTDDGSAFAGLATLNLPTSPTAAQIATALAARGLVTLT